MASESVASTIRLAMRHRTRNSGGEDDARPPAASFSARIAAWCKHIYARARGGPRHTNGEVARQFSAPSDWQSSTRAAVQRLEGAFRELCANVDTLHARIHELETRERCASPVRGGAGLNLNSKSQVLKLARNGQGAKTIASTLGVPVGEVDFLLKVQRLLNRPVERQQKASGQ